MYYCIGCKVQKINSESYTFDKFLYYYNIVANMPVL
jgi:hypothetical protein